MSRRPFFRATFAVFAILWVAGHVSSVSGELTLSRRIWDFESVEQGESKTQKILLKNSGTEPLKITGIELPEECSVTPDLANKEIQPAEEIEAEFTFSPEKTLGKLQQYAHITLADSTIIPVTIKGEVFAKAQPRLQLRPSMWDFRSATVGETKQTVFQCENVGTGELKIEKVQIFDPNFRVVRNITKETLAPGEKVDFAVSVTGRAPGKSETDFYVKSNSTGRPFTKVSVTGYIVSKTSGLSVSSNLGMITNNTPFTAEIIRVDNTGKSETLTVEKDSEKSFPMDQATSRKHPSEFTLTIKLLRPPLPGTSPATPPKVDTTEAEEKPAETTTTPEGTPPPGTGEGDSVTKPEEKEGSPSPEETKPPTTPEKEEPAPQPEEKKPSEEAVSKPPAPEKSESPEQEEAKKPEEEKEAAPTAPGEAEKPGESAASPEGEKPADKPEAGAPAEPEKSSGPSPPPEKPSGDSPSGGE